jgi:hypothetical protein
MRTTQRWWPGLISNTPGPLAADDRGNGDYRPDHFSCRHEKDW